MTQELLYEIEGLSLKFSSGKRAEDVNNAQSARDMIIAVLKSLKEKGWQIELLQRLGRSEGRSLGDLSTAISKFLENKMEEVKSSRHVIGKLKLKRRATDGNVEE